MHLHCVYEESWRCIWWAPCSKVLLFLSPTVEDLFPPALHHKGLSFLLIIFHILGNGRTSEIGSTIQYLFITKNWEVTMPRVSIRWPSRDRWSCHLFRASPSSPLVTVRISDLFSTQRNYRTLSPFWLSTRNEILVPDVIYHLTLPGIYIYLTCSFRYNPLPRQTKMSFFPPETITRSTTTAWTIKNFP